jgi:glutathione S-transferase
MKLIYSPPSPFARKVLVLAHEIGVYDQLEHVHTAVAPTSLNDKVAMWNPLGKVPALILDTGEALFDSRVICDYLSQTMQNRTQSASEQNEQQWAIAKTQALADGILDAAILIRYEVALRPEEKRWSEWIDGQMRKVRSALDYLEKTIPVREGPVNIGQIALGCALGYLDFRFMEENWRTNRPALTAFYQDFSQRPSMAKTAPA